MLEKNATRRSPHADEKKSPMESPVGFIAGSLSARVLLLTVFFVMIAELLIWTPSISRFRKVYMEDRIVRAHLATLTLDSLPQGTVDMELEDKLLFHAEAYGIALSHPEKRLLMVSKAMPPKVDLRVDLTEDTMVGWIGGAFDTLVQDQNRVLRVVGKSHKDPNIMVELTMDETPMREAMYEFSARIFKLSIGISFFTAFLVYASLQWLMIRPIKRITANITAFRRAPDDATREIKPSGRSDEIGITERELATMQDEVRHALSQRNRLATLGAAVAKVNHDLRNSLASAVLAYDKLLTSDDPEVKRTLPRLYESIDRAVKLCSQTLNYVGDTAPQLDIERLDLVDLIEEVRTNQNPDDLFDDMPNETMDVDWQCDIPPGLKISGDRSQLFRVFNNLACNAVEAGAKTIFLSAERVEENIVVEFADDGPGLPDKAKQRMFQPFAGSAKEGGTGLGLVIVREIVRAHGGDFVFTDPEFGAAFQLTFPAARLTT
jgi:signal transduction histidine kinase